MFRIEKWSSNVGSSNCLFTKEPLGDQTYCKGYGNGWGRPNKMLERNREGLTIKPARTILKRRSDKDADKIFELIKRNPERVFKDT